MQALLSVLTAVVLLPLVTNGQPVCEILGWPTANSVTVNALFEFDAEFFFQCGPAPGVYDLTTPTFQAARGIPLVVVFDGLSPDRRYHYRTAYRLAGSMQSGYGQEHSFRTQRAPGAGFTFAITADSHLYDKKGDPAMMRETMSTIAEDAPDFLIDLGDTFGDDHTPETTTRQDMDDLHRNLLPNFGMGCHSAPLFLCLGNNEGENGYYLLQTPPENIAVFGTLARKNYYSNPVPDGFSSGNVVAEPYGIGLPENYHAWQWGDAQFIVLDAYRGYTTSEKPGGWDWTLGETQYQWFAATLRNSTAKYRFVIAHHINGQGRGGVVEAGLFEWGGRDRKGEYGFDAKRPGWEAPIHSLMVRYGVNVFFQGHDHLFAQEMLDGVVYQEAPMPSDSSHEIGMLANADAYVSNQVRGTGYLHVYDALGRLVSSLCDDELQAGAHARNWDGRTRDGRIAPRGLYVLRLQTPGGIRTRHMVVQ